MGSLETDPVPSVDISAFTSESDPTWRQQTAWDFAEKTVHNGCLIITGHGIPPDLLAAAFGASKTFFALPYEDKMKAPHPAAPFPHRGYSHVGREKGSTKKPTTPTPATGVDSKDSKTSRLVKLHVRPEPRSTPQKPQLEPVAQADVFVQRRATSSAATPTQPSRTFGRRMTYARTSEPSKRSSTGVYTRRRGRCSNSWLRAFS